MESIRFLNLTNKGAFVARIRIKGTHANGKTYSFNLSQNITAGKARCLDLADTDNVIQDGDTVYLEAYVAAGKDNKAKETFVFKKNSVYKASYTIKGTTLNNKMSFDGITEDLTTVSTPIDHIELKNSGAFVARIKINGTHKDGTKYTYSSSKDITVGNSQRIELAEVCNKVQDGDSIRLEVNVVAGLNPISKEVFTYKKGSNRSAIYSIKGTTLNNTLTFNKTEECVSVQPAVKQKIRWISLKNSGAFVAKIQINGTHSNGSKYSFEISNSIVVGKEPCIDLADTNGKISYGDEINLKVIVVAGYDKTAAETFTYDYAADTTAQYEIKGTTLNNTLLFKGLSKISPVAPKIEKLMCASSNCNIYGIISASQGSDNIVVERATIVNKKQSSFAVQKMIVTENGGSFIDATTQSGNTYVYRAYAESRSGLKSPYSAEKSIVCQGKAPEAPRKPILKSEPGRIVITSCVSALATEYEFHKIQNGKDIQLGTSNSVIYVDDNPQYNVLNTYYVIAKNPSGSSKKSETSSIHFYKNRKALCIATSANGRSPNSNLQMAKAFERNGIHSEVIVDVTKAQLQSKIKSYFKDFDENDLAILTIYAHGNEGYVWILRDDEGRDIGTSFDTLKEIFDTIPCHKILFISSCHSGSAIDGDNASQSGMSMMRKMTIQSFDPNAFKNSILKVFGNTTSKLLRKNSFTGGMYSVLCTSKADENTFGKSSTSTTQIYGYVVESWCKGLGWDLSFFEAANNDIVDQKADSDDNRVVTVAELSKYASKNVVTSTPFCYPENDDTIIVSY